MEEEEAKTPAPARPRGHEQVACSHATYICTPNKLAVSRAGPRCLSGLTLVLVCPRVAGRLVAVAPTCYKCRSKAKKTRRASRTVRPLTRD